MVHAAHEPQQPPKQVCAALQRARAIQIIGQEPLAHATARAFVGEAQLCEQNREWRHVVVERLVRLAHAALAHARVVRVHRVGQVVTERDVEHIVRA